MSVFLTIQSAVKNLLFLFYDSISPANIKPFRKGVNNLTFFVPVKILT